MVQVKQGSYEYVVVKVLWSLHPFVDFWAQNFVAPSVYIQSSDVAFQDQFQARLGNRLRPDSDGKICSFLD